MPVVSFHLPAEPLSCEVCRYLQERPEYDARREHTLTRFAQAIVVEDLTDARAPLRMSAIYQETIGDPGPTHRLEPRHWLLALLETPEVRLQLTAG